MNRDLLKCKAKRVVNVQDVNENWVFGYFVEHESGPSIIHQNLGDGSLELVNIIEETVSRCTGLKDDTEEKVDIYDKDILLGTYYSEGPNGEDLVDTGTVMWGDEYGKWVVQEIYSGETFDLYDWCDHVRVISNVQDGEKIISDASFGNW